MKKLDEENWVRLYHAALVDLQHATILAASAKQGLKRLLESKSYKICRAFAPMNDASSQRFFIVPRRSHQGAILKTGSGLSVCPLPHKSEQY